MPCFVIDEGDKSMLKLSPDETFNYELLRVLATSRAYGADVAEVLTVAEKVTPHSSKVFLRHYGKSIKTETVPYSMRLYGKQ